MIVVYMNRLYLVIAEVMMLGVGVSGLHEQILHIHSLGNDVRCRCKRFT